MQLGLFGSSEIPKLGIREKISWSYSKMGTLKQCPRKFYYQYYGSKKRVAKEQLDKERLHFLSDLSNKNLVPGEIVHSIIAIYFRKFKNGEQWTLERLQSFASHMLNESLIYSQEKKEGVVKVRKFPPPIFKELYYSMVEESDLREEVSEKIRTNLANFYNSELYEDLRCGGVTADSIIEGKSNFEIGETIKVDGVIDLCYVNNNKIIIADWKSGKSEVEETSLQLLTYAQWAINKKKVSSDNIVIQKAYLMENKLEDLEFSDIHLARAKARIIQDVEILRELDEFGKSSVIDAFTKCSQKKICDQCPYQEICDKS